MKTTVYLCGPMEQLSAAEACGWRQELTRLLGPDIDVIDPTVEDRPIDGRYGLEDEHRAPIKELICKDLTFIDRATVVVRYWQGKSSEGSCMEHFYAAHVKRKPVIVVTAPGLVEQARCNPWLSEHTTRLVTSLQQAADVVRTVWTR